MRTPAARSPGRRAPREAATFRSPPCRWRPSIPLARLLLPVQPERGVQRPHRALHVVLGNHARDPNRRRADHLDVHALVGERLEHPSRNTGVRLHPGADERYATDVIVRTETARFGVDDDLLHATPDTIGVSARHGERDIGVAGA